MRYDKYFLKHTGANFVNDNRFTDRLPILFQKMLNLNIGIFKCRLYEKHILGDKRLVVQFFSSTIANKDFPLELHVKLMLTTTHLAVESNEKWPAFAAL